MATSVPSRLRRRRSFFGQLARMLGAGVVAGLALASDGGLRGDDFQRTVRPQRAAPGELSGMEDARPLAPARNHERSAAVTSWSQPSGGAGSAPRVRPISDQSNAWRLRWRSPGEPQTLSATSSSPMAVSRAVLVWNDSDAGTRTAVRQASQITPVDPLQDPFGDRPAPSASGETLDAAPSLDAPELPAVRDNQPLPLTPPAGSSAVPSELPEIPPTDAPPAPPPGMDAPRGGLGAPEAFPSPPAEEKPCDRTYNLRNCCVEGDKCNEARRFVRGDKITKILVDITPSFTNTDQEVATNIAMRNALAKAPSRIWKNRSGQQVAEGRLADYRQGRIKITGDDGQTVQIPFKELSDDDLCFVTAWWSLPTECLLDDEQYLERNWLATNMMWKASALCHKPLYFEDVQLERYGHTSGPLTEPFVSAAHFFGSLVTVPYQMGIHPPQECMYSLGYYRPGSCAPWLVPPLPLSIRGGLAEAGAILGGIYVIP